MSVALSLNSKYGDACDQGPFPESIFSLSGSQSGSYEHRTVFTPFPETTGRLEWIEGADYVGADKWRTDETARAIEGRKLEAAREIERKAAQKRESNRRSREKRKAKEAGRKTQKTGKRTEAGKA